MRSRILCLLGLIACNPDTTTDPPEPVEPAPDASVPTPPPDAAPVPEPDAAPTCGATGVHLGTGVTQYQPMQDGGTVYLYRGPQNGYMIYFSIQALGLDPADDTFCYTEKFADTGKVFGMGCWRVRLTNDLGNGWFERVGIWGQVDSSYWTSPATIRGKAVRVDSTMTDTHGRQVTAGWNVLVSDQPGM